MKNITNWWLTQFLFILNFSIFSTSGNDRLRCYGCFYDHETGLGRTCKVPNKRDYTTACKSQEDVDKAVSYIGTVYVAQKKQLLESRSGNVDEEDGVQFVCIDAQGNFTGMRLGYGTFRSCWAIPKSQPLLCGEIKLETLNNTVYGCFCDRNHKDGLPCNGVHEGGKSSLELRNSGDEKHHDEEDLEDVGATVKSNSNHMMDHLTNAIKILMLMLTWHYICVIYVIT